MAAQEYTLTRGGDVVTTSSQATVDYLLTQGWVVGASTGLPQGPASPQALDERVYLLEQNALYSHELLPNTDFQAWDTPTEPRGYGGFWGSGTRTQSRDMDIFRTGDSSWKVALVAGAFARFGSQRFTVRPQDNITCTWVTRSSTVQGKFDAMLMTTDGKSDPNFFGVDVNQQGGSTKLQTVVGEWAVWTQSWVVPRGHKMGRIYVTAQAADGSAISVWLDSMSVKAASEAAVDLQPGWITPALGASWSGYGGEYGTAQYTKRNGIVFMRGLIKAGTTGNLFTLPTGYRPLTGAAEGTHLFVCACNLGSARIDVRGADGLVIMNGYQGTGDNQWVSLANVIFPADA